MRAYLPILVLVAGCDLFTRGGGDGKDPVDNTSGVTDGTEDFVLPLGASCTLSPDACATGTVCASDGVCQAKGAPGTAEYGEPCVGNDFCGYELVCGASQTCAGVGEEGTAGFGEACGGVGDCQAFLSCSPSGTCAGFQPPLWLGGACTDPALDGEFRAFFEIPRSGPLSDFYRLPFPNDIRIRPDGTLNLEGHPTPGILIPEIGDVAADVLALMEDEMGAWGNNQAALFRVSGTIDASTLDLGSPTTGTIGVIDITPGAAKYGEFHGNGWKYSSNRGAYICHNWLGIYPSGGNPYLAGHTYAAFLGSDIRIKDGTANLAQDSDFALMLATTPPADTVLAAAWERYAPFRAYLADQSISTSSIAAAAVFTVQDPHAPMRDLRDAVLAADLPETSGLYLCDGDVGPYPTLDDPDRGCGGVSAGWDEIQGKVTLPRFQGGTPPYKTRLDGGMIDFSKGIPSTTGTEEAHFALTVPKGVAMPEGGWPLVIYGHGTNGMYRSFVVEGLPDMLSDVVLDDGTHVNFAILSIDALHHGERRHPEVWDADWLALDPDAYAPDTLFFNPLNPRAARDNVLQGGAEGYALVRLAKSLDWDAESSPTGEALKFDPSQLYYLGHSQGTQTGVPFVAWEDDLAGAVFSGGGGLLIESFLAKTKPYDLPTTLKVGLADPDLHRAHPLLNLAQAWAERSDPSNHGRSYFREVPEGVERKHVFQTFGIGDSYSPDTTQFALARSFGGDQVTNGNSPIEILDEVLPPVSSNWSNYTVAVGLYSQVGANDPHFVLFDVPLAGRQASHFLGTAVRDGVPTVVGQ